MCREFMGQASGLCCALKPHDAAAVAPVSLRTHIFPVDAHFLDTGGPFQ